MPVVYEPPPRPSEFGRGIELAAGFFANTIMERKERQERDKILRRGTLNTFFDKALKTVQTEDQANRIFDGIEKNNELPPGSIPQEVRTLLLGEANLNQELARIKKADLEAKKNLANTRTFESQVKTGLAVGGAELAERKQGFEERKAGQTFQQNLLAAEQARLDSEQRRAESRERTLGLEAKRKAGPAKEKPSVTVRENAATRELLFKEDLRSIGFAPMSMREFEKLYSKEGGFDPAGVSPENAAKVNLLIDKHGLTIPKLEEERVPSLFLPKSLEGRKFTQKGGTRLPIKRAENPVDILKEATALLPGR